MSGGPDPQVDPELGPEAAERVAARERARRRARLAEVFGDDLPQTTSDERDPDAARAGRDADTWLREQVPPHHGG